MKGIKFRLVVLDYVNIMQNGEVLTPVRAGELKSLLSELLGKTPRSIAEIAEEKKAQEA
jgi:hypothetical protein